MMLEHVDIEDVLPILILAGHREANCLDVEHVGSFLSCL